MSQGLLIRNVRPWARLPGDAPVDILCVDGRIQAISPDPTVPQLGELVEIDGRGGVALPGLVDAHTHLDSSRLGLPFRPHSAGEGLIELIENDRRNWRQAGASVADRATLTTARMIECGITRIRTHAQIDTDCRLERLDGVVAARDAHQGRVDIEIVAFPSRESCATRGPSTCSMRLSPTVPTLSAASTLPGSTGIRCATSTRCSGWPRGTSGASTSICTTAASSERSSST